MGNRTQEANAKNKRRLEDEIYPLLTAGTPLSEDQNAFLKVMGDDRTIAGNSFRQFLATHSLDKDLADNPELKDLTTQAQQAGEIPRTALFEQETILSNFEQLSPALLEFEKQLLRSDAEIQAEFLPIFEKLRLETDVEMLKAFGPEFVDIEKQLRPEDAAIRKSLQESIQTDLDAGVGLTPDLQREVEQGVRGAQSARGTLNGNAAITAEAFARGSRGLALQDRRRNAASNLLQLNAQTQLDPISTILGRSVTRSPVNVSNRFDDVSGDLRSDQERLGSGQFNFQQNSLQRAAEAAASRRARKSGESSFDNFNKFTAAASGLGNAVGSLVEPFKPGGF